MNLQEFKKDLAHKQEGAIGYLLAWFMGVPATVLFVIFLLRGGD